MHAETNELYIQVTFFDRHNARKAPWQYAEVSVTRKGCYRWENEAGETWRMDRTENKSKLRLGRDSPYFSHCRYVKICRDDIIGVRALKVKDEEVGFLIAIHPMQNKTYAQAHDS